MGPILKYARLVTTSVVSRKKEFVLAPLVGITGILCALVAFAAPAAHADNGIVFSSYDWSYSNVSFTVQDSAISNGSSSGKIQVAFTMPHGLPKSVQQKATKCLVAANDTRPARAGEKCGHIKIGTSMTNSGTCRSTGRFCMFGDHVHAGDTFYLNNGQWRKGKCGNKVWFAFAQPRPKGPVLPASRVQVVQYFTSVAKVTVKATQSARVMADARCSTSSSSAAATASGSGSATATASATASARTSAQAIAIATGAAQQDITLNQSESLKTSAAANAKVQLALNASAVVSCSSTPPGTTTVITTTTTPGTTTTTTTTPPQAQHSCSLDLSQDKSFANVVYTSVNTNGEAVAKVRYYWDSSHNSNFEDVYSLKAAHTYPAQAPGPYGTGITYQIHAVCYFGDGQTRDGGTLPFWYPAPPPNGNGGPPPAP